MEDMSISSSSSSASLASWLCCCCRGEPGTGGEREEVAEEESEVKENWLNRDEVLKGLASKLKSDWNDDLCGGSQPS
jgi:hypothetical protein